MTEMKIFLLCGVLGSVSGQFFHESSGVTLKPPGGLETSAFGFSIAYQKHTGSPARLLVGAPREDYVGKVYSCPLSDLSSVNCSVDVTSLQIDNHIPATRKLEYPDANYLLGSSIAATSDYFFTCAPFLIKSIELAKLQRKIRQKPIYKFEKETDTFGGCYVIDNTNATEWIDSIARLEDKHKSLIKKNVFPDPPLSFGSLNYLRGAALGWNTLVDDTFLIAAKSGYYTDIMYTSVDKPLNSTSRSILDEKIKVYGRNFFGFFNMGYGLAIGNFFSETEKLYAVSVKKNETNGTIFFLQKKHDRFRGVYLDMMEESASNLTTIETYALSSMFGYAMAAADMNRDGLSELLVGAPAETDDGRQELGALHIFVGGDLLSRNDKKRMRTVLADEVNGRFGSAIATSDIDGDSLPEIFVSAPYEDSGVVYVLSGYELKQVFFREDGFKRTRLSDLKLTQQLRGGGGLKLFGFSLQVVKDIDQNGCDELAIGAPDSNSVKLVRCLPAVNTSLTLELLGDSNRPLQPRVCDGIHGLSTRADSGILPYERTGLPFIVAYNAKSFTVRVCLNVTINKRCQSVSGNISVESSTTGHAQILAPKFTHSMTDKALPHCELIQVNLTSKSEKTDYIFTTKLSMIGANSSAYSSKAVFSAYSEIEKSLTVRQYRTGVHGEPDLSYQIFWSGNLSIDFSKKEAINETVTFVLTNENYDAHRVVLEFSIKGALARSGECDIKKNIVNYKEEANYTCALVKILSKGDPYNMTIPIYLPAPTNSLNLTITAKLYDAGFPNKTYVNSSLVIPYKLNASDVTVKGSNNSLNVTDKDLLDGIKFAESSSIHQEFIISNTGPVTWYDIVAVLQIENDYIQNVTVVTRSENEKWDEQYDRNDSSKIIFLNPMTIKSKSKKIIEVSMMLNTGKLEGDVNKGNLSINSVLSFCLDPLSDTREVKSSTQITYKQILSVANDKLSIIVIVVIVSVLLLLILMLILYKNGFFKRAEKKKLSVLRESIRKRSVRLASESSRGIRPSVADGAHCEIEVVDDCAFHEVDLEPTSTRSDLSLVETSPKEHTS